MIYKYEDIYIVSNVDDETIEYYENLAISKVTDLNIYDEFDKVKAIKYLVYIDLCLIQSENEDIEKKYKNYKREYEKILVDNRVKAPQKRVGILNVYRS